jgi:hypothetical protein
VLEGEEENELVVIGYDDELFVIVALPCLRENSARSKILQA